VDFDYTSNRSLGLIQALKAMLVGMWMVVEFFENHIKGESGAQSDRTQAKEERPNKKSKATKSEGGGADANAKE
jgi:hypothetical protein